MGRRSARRVQRWVPFPRPTYRGPASWPRAAVGLRAKTSTHRAAAGAWHPGRSWLPRTRAHCIRKKTEHIYTCVNHACRPERTAYRPGDTRQCPTQGDHGQDGHTAPAVTVTTTDLFRSLQRPVALSRRLHVHEGQGGTVRPSRTPSPSTRRTSGPRHPNGTRPLHAARVTFVRRFLPRVYTQAAAGVVCASSTSVQRKAVICFLVCKRARESRIKFRGFRAPKKAIC